MKLSQIAAYLACFLCFSMAFSQTNPLTTLPSTVYLEESKKSIQATLDSEKHRTLFEALKVTDLEDVLEMSGPFTVFAPSNDAFQRFSAEELEDLFKTENRQKLKSLLTYHIVAGNLTASKILRAMCRGEGKATFTTVQGNKISASMQGIDIILTDSLGNTAKITAADVGQSNGVIHEIDSVILPQRI